MSLPSRASVIEVMHRANDHFMAAHPEAAAPTFVKKERPSNLWTRGVYFEGLCALLATDRQARDSAYLADWAEGHAYTPRNGTSTRDADDYCCCQAYLALFAAHRQERMRQPTRECMDHLLATAGTHRDWTWVDAVQMGLPVLTRLAALDAAEGRATAARYAEQGWRMYAYTRDSLAGGLLNRADGLWWRDADFTPPMRTAAGRQCYWSRGNGWAYAALVRAIDDLTPLPRDCRRHLADYRRDFRLMSRALRSCRRADGFWNVSLADSTDFAGPELTGTALFVYGMAYGVRTGLLPRKKYAPLIASSWHAMVTTAVDRDGRLGYVQGTGKEPKDSQPVRFDTAPDFDDFGLGCFLLAASEVAKLCR